ncbi:hypothetical protein W823_14970 [Williamsia sp. D3]|nr:hypothetical protein W823_14970 [Williamsia sp. D3]
MTFKIAVYKYIWCLIHCAEHGEIGTSAVEYETAYWSNPKISEYHKIRL